MEVEHCRVGCLQAVLLQAVLCHSVLYQMIVRHSDLQGRRMASQGFKVFMGQGFLKALSEVLLLGDHHRQGHQDRWDLFLVVGADGVGLDLPAGYLGTLVTR